MANYQKTFLNSCKSTFCNLLLLFFACPLLSQAQLALGAVSNAALAEKIYLQLDRGLYSTTDTIWFKCIVANASDHAPTKLSGVLSTELVSPAGKVAQSKLIKLDNGIGSGYFGLDKKAPEGAYQVRAHARWNNNFGIDMVFVQHINVFSSTKGIGQTPISGVTLVTGKNGVKTLKAVFDPLSIDSLHSNKLKVYVSTGGKADTLRLSKSNGNKYLFERTVPDSCKVATLGMGTSGGKSYSKTVLLNPNYTNLRFFPEGGELVHGLPSKVGFKSVDENGKGLFVQGDIVDEKDSVVAAFKSNALGMGSFSLAHVDTAKTYYARLASKTDGNKVLLAPLPKVAKLGNTLSVKSDSAHIYFAALSNYMESDSVTIMVSCRGMVCFSKKVRLKEGAYGGRLPVGMLPDGIVAFTLLDWQGQPVAERLCFNQRPESRLNLALSTDSAAYQKRGQVNLSVSATSVNGEPAKASLSVLAINKEQLGEMQQTGQNILSYFLLDSELKGDIENPGHYFGSGHCTAEDLDALLLAQGWRRYLYSKPYDILTFAAERNLEITGKVTGGFWSNKERDAKLTMMTFGKGLQAATTMTDSTGKFCFALDDEYANDGQIEVVVQSAKETGKKVDYTVNINKRLSPPVLSKRHTSIDRLDSIGVEIVKKEEERKKVERAFRLESGNILLEGIEVVGHKRTEKSKRIIEMAGMPNEILDGQTLLEKEEDWSFGIFNVLMYSSELIIIVQDTSNFNFTAKVLGSDTTLILVDGEYDFNTDILYSLPTSEVSSIDVIRCANNFHQIYAQTFGGAMTPKEDELTLVTKRIKTINCGAIININTKSGKGVLNAYMKPVGINRFKIPVFSTPKEYYSPNYKNMDEKEKNRPDLRPVLHWQPQLATNKKGIATTSFYNSDNVGDMVIVVEGISDKGEIGYQTTEYKVRGKQSKLIFVD